MREFPFADSFLRRRLMNCTLTVVSLLLVLVGQAKATIVSELHVPRLTEQADCVVRGKVVSVDEPKGDDIPSVVLVDARAKGEFSKGNLHINYLAPAPMVISDILTVGDYGLFFLKKTAKGYVPVDSQNIKMSVREGRPIGEPKEQDALQFVYEEVLFTASGPSVLSKEDEITKALLQEALEKHKAKGILSNNRYVVYGGRPRPVPMNIRALNQLVHFSDNKRTLDLLGNLLSSPESDLRIVAATTLLSFNDLRGFKIVVAFLNSPESENPPSLLVHDFSINAMGTVGMLNNVDAIDLLGELMNNKQVEVRQAATMALRNIGRQLRQPPLPIKELSKGKTIPFLVQALDDTDVRVRFYAVAGLAEITQKLDWYPKHSSWEKEFDPVIEQQQVRYWKQWWEIEGKKAFEQK